MSAVKDLHVHKQAAHFFAERSDCGGKRFLLYVDGMFILHVVHHEFLFSLLDVFAFSTFNQYC